MNLMRKRINELKDAIRHPYAWPGGYAKRILLSDGETLCQSCCKEHFRSILDSTKHQLHDGWVFETVYIHWEGDSEYCAHCNAQLDSEYGPVE